ncbi:YfcC family protein [Helcococcus ovis]|uniref:YfcC family protein n=1 Tax=Helcococcus ovis TaxID=72026 RepID=A0A4R9C4T3_9FIRM|nr:YfcC family protein [Helcococcus ovis]TFF65563.1 YfcC family protein [Helcococcus ovis]TFF67667.1 YfcC family protein [Helcococcus ovis]
MTQKKKNSLSAFSILMIVLAIVCIVTIFFNGKPINSEIIKSLDPKKYGELINLVKAGETVAVKSAKLSDFVMAIPNGFKDAADLIIFIMCIGGFIGVVMSTGAMNAGIRSLVKSNKGKEGRLIAILMFLFSIGGSTYGMAEETIGFYPLITAAMVAAGFDTMVAVGTVLLGAGAGVLGSTINPFATSAAMGALESVGVAANATTVMIIGIILWLITDLIVIKFVLDYAKKVKQNKENSILTFGEKEDMTTHFSQDNSEEIEFTRTHKAVLIVFAITFVIMIVSLISYSDIVFNGDEDAYIKAFGWSKFLTGESLGRWYFADLAALFTISSIIIAIVARMREKVFIDNFLAGAADLLSVGLIIAVARGITIVMSSTHLDFYILQNSANLLKGVSPFVFAPMAYLIYMLLSFLVPSTSGLAALSIPIMGSLAYQLGYNPNVMIMIFCGACGLVNFITPTSGVVMGGLAAAKVEYSTYLNWVKKPFVIIMISNIIILSIAMYVL